MPRLLIALVLSLISLPLLAAQPAQVMLFGTFHFKDAGLDTVKVKDIDISTEANQAYLEALTQRLQGFKPTQVLLEYSPPERTGCRGRRTARQLRVHRPG